jgi:hypothetical protein
MKTFHTAPLPSQDELHHLFYYDPEIGLRWRERDGDVRFNKCFAGKVAGCVNPGGYRQLGVKRGGKTVNWLAHRLVWAFHHGDCPHGLDQINGNRQDNRIENLRPATNIQQNANRRTKRNGLKGVAFVPSTGRYCAGVKAAGVSYYLGQYTTEAEAHAAYAGAAIVLFGEYACTSR